MNDAARKRLWEDYARLKTPDLREKLILEYAPLVKVVAGRLSMYLGYNVEYEDLVSYGVFGLIDAIDKFDRNKEVKFETYASLRIRGAILDQILLIQTVFTDDVDLNGYFILMPDLESYSKMLAGLGLSV